jgi:hypothetical protein
MVSNFLDTLAAEKKQDIKNRTGILVDLLGEWAQQHPAMRAPIPTIALTAAVAMPRVSVPDALTWAQAIAWIFIADYKADPQAFTPQDMLHRAEQWYSIASNWPTCDVDDSDELTMIVVDMTRDLSSSPMFKPLREYWASRVRSHFVGFAQRFQYSLEYRDHGPQALPSLDGYLRAAIESVGWPFLGSMAMIFHRDSSVMEHLEPISEILECAGAALRLYNDIATLNKEIRIRDVNSILIMSHELLSENPNTALERVMPEAKQRILQLADSYAQKCYRLIGQLKTDSGQIEETCSRILDLYSYFHGYTEQDYHTTPLAKIYQMVDDTLLEN